jgi:hypothetical protein
MSPTLKQPSPIMSQILAIIHNEDMESFHRPAALGLVVPGAASSTRNTRASCAAAEVLAMNY